MPNTAFNQTGNSLYGFFALVDCPGWLRQSFGHLRRMDIKVFEKHNKDDYTNLLPGIRQKTLVFGDRTLMTEFLLTKDSVLPNHSHPYEQTGYLVKGHITLKIGEKEYDTAVGDSWCIPSNVNHGAKIIEDSVAIEIFSPVREDYLPKERKK